MLKKIVKASFVLASGTIGGQLFVLAASPFLTRLYSPADFGIFGVYAALLYILSAFSAFRYEVAIPLLKKDRDAQCLAGAAILIVLVFSFACFIVLSLASVFFDAAPWKTFRWILPVGLLLAGIYNVLMYYQLRQGNYSVIARVRASQAVGGASFQIGTGLLGVGSIGLIIGQIIGISGGGVIMGGRREMIGFFEGFSFRRAVVQLRRQIDFAKFGAPAAFLQIANSHCITLILGLFFSPSSAGVYALVQRISITPFAIISAAISASLISFGKEIKEEKERRPISMQSLLMAIMGPVSVVASLIFYLSFQRVFGDQWAGGARIAAWVVLIVAQKFIFDSIFSLTTAEGEQKKGLKLQAMVFFIRHAAFFSSLIFFEFETAIIIFSVSSAVVYFFATKMVLISSKVMSTRIKDALMLLDLALPYSIVAALLYRMGSEYFIPLCIFSTVWFFVRLVPVYRLAASRVG